MHTEILISVAVGTRLPSFMRGADDDITTTITFSILLLSNTAFEIYYLLNRTRCGGIRTSSS